MRKKRSNGGFTLAELLIVVAIIGVLSGVAFIAVQNHEKSLTQLERDTIAKEIFIAAQNHLTVAKSQNYNGCTNYGREGTVAGDYKGTEDEETKEQIVYYFSNKGFDANGNSIVDQMLPFGSIDETIRSGDGYIIRYQPSAGLVLDVFYWDASDKKYGGTIAENSAYATLMGMRGEEQQQKRGRLNNKPMVGWFGGEETVETGEFLETPTLEVSNANKLIVKVTDKNVNNNAKESMAPMLKLILEGQSSGARLAFTLTWVDGSTGNWMGALPNPSEGEYTRLVSATGTGDITYEIVLDDITSENMRFAQINQLGQNVVGSDGTIADKYMKHAWDPNGTSQQFVPGEDIKIQAVAYSNTSLSSIAYSGAWTVNSLFGGLRTNADNSVTALISNFRHLENLDNRVSSVNSSQFVSAEQAADLDWDAFIAGASVYSYGKDEDDNDVVWATKPGCYLPVSPSYALTYSGQSSVTDEATGTVTTANHSVANIVVNDTAETTDPTGTNTAVISTGGMFGTLAAGSKVSNLELKDINVTLTASGNAGALAGTIANTNISNVVAYNTDARTTASISAPGSVGGLIGSVTASAATYKVEKSAAALVVSSAGGNAGGLIGTTSGGTISACYSGGHTMEKKNGTGDKAEVIGVIYDPDNFNVTGSAYAGGLIGEAGAATISNSYSTCSAKGKNVGGLVGKASGTITNSYCTGLVGVIVGSDGKPVSGTSAGAFAAECTGTTTGCSYFGIVNEFEDETLGYDYLTALPKVGTGDGSKEGVTALDADANAYNTFTSVWSDAVPYLKTTLMSYYGEGTGTARVPKYNLKSVEQLARGTGSLKTDPDDTTEYFVATHYGDWPAPEIFVENKGN